MPPFLCPMSVEDYCLAAKNLLRQNRHADFVNMMLCGTNSGEQVTIDTIVNAVDPFESLLGTRDYDSVIGISKNIRVTSALTVHPVAKHDDTLTRDVHLKYTFTTSEGELCVPIHKVPNVSMGKWDTHHKVLALFPGLYREGRSSQLTQDEMSTFYDKGLRPAVASLTPTTVREWPATYSDEMFRARGHNGRLSFCTKVIGNWLIPDFGDAIRKALDDNGCPWGKGLVFLHQVRGVKHSSTHSVDEDSAEGALDIFLKKNGLGVTMQEREREGDAWWVDVGVEVMSDFGQCVAWRTDSHPHIVERVLSISSDAAGRLTKPGSSLYTRDLTSHLTAVSGCRITPGTRDGPHDVAYVQLYSTDKAIIYRPDGTAHGKYIKAAEILAGKGPKFCANLVELYNNAIETCLAHARIELRVPLREAGRVLLSLDDALIRESLVSFNPRVWWSLRSLRATAFKFVAEWQSQGDPKSRSQPSALLLTAACSVMLSSLHSTLDSGASTRELLTLILPHVRRAGADPDILAFGSARREDDEEEEEEEEEEPAETGEPAAAEAEESDHDDNVPRIVKPRGASTLPANPYGMVYFRALRIGPDHPVPRFDRVGIVTELSKRAYMYFFNEPDHESIGDELSEALISVPVNPNRVKNKAKPNRHAPYHIPGENPGQPVFKLKAKGVRIPPRPRDTGSDVEMEEVDDAQGVQPPDDSDPDVTSTDIWRSFIVDITRVSPNPKGASKSSYTILTKNERLIVNEDTYKNPVLSEYFSDCQWKYADHAEWDQCFDYFFPDKSQPPRSSRTQNYFKTVYFPKWEELKQRMDAQSHAQLRRALKARFDTLYWMPSATKERIWHTRFNDKMEKSSLLPRKAPSPGILINSGPDKPPRW